MTALRYRAPCGETRVPRQFGAAGGPQPGELGIHAARRLCGNRRVSTREQRAEGGVQASPKPSARSCMLTSVSCNASAAKPLESDTPAAGWERTRAAWHAQGERPVWPLGERELEPVYLGFEVRVGDSFQVFVRWRSARRARRQRRAAVAAVGRWEPDRPGALSIKPAAVLADSRRRASPGSRCRRAAQRRLAARVRSMDRLDQRGSESGSEQQLRPGTGSGTSGRPYATSLALLRCPVAG